MNGAVIAGASQDDEVVRKEGSIQLIAVTNTEGHRISQVHTQRGEKPLFRNLLNKDFRFIIKR